MKYIKIDSGEITDEVFKDYEAKHGYKFSDKLIAELRKAFSGEVALEKFRPRKPSPRWTNSQALIILDALHRHFQIPTSKEWSAILLAAETMAAKGNKDAEDLLNHNKNGMLSNGSEVTSTALLYWSGKEEPAGVIDNIMTFKEVAKTLEWAPERAPGFVQKKEIPELGLPMNSAVYAPVPKTDGLSQGGLCPVIRMKEGFTTSIDYGIHFVSRSSASRAIKRKER